MDSITLWESAGVFRYPLLMCSGIAVFVIIERGMAIRKKRLLTSGSQAGQLLKELKECDEKDSEAMRAKADYLLSKLERGLYWLEVVTGAAPLIGLLGTVTGLVKVFGNFSFSELSTQSDTFIAGVSLALTTTMIGIAIAVPAMIASAVFSRKIEVISQSFAIEVAREIKDTKLSE